MTAPIAKIPADPIAEIAPRIEHYASLIAEWLRDHFAELLIAATVATLIFLLLSWMRRRASKIARESDDRSAIKAIVARTLARTGKFFRIMTAVELVNGYANAPAPIARTIDILFTIAVVLQVAIWLREIILGMIERRAGDSGGEHETLASAMVLIRLLVSFALFAIAAIVILDNLGVNVTGLVAGLGVGGIAIGLAAQGIFQDLFAAISIIFDKPFKRGDVVNYDTTTATVERIGMKSTRLRALSGEEKIIGNSKLLEKEITNFTQLHYRRTTYVLALVYHTPVDKIAALPAQLEALVVANGGVFIRSGFVNFSASSIDIQLVFDVETTDYNEVFVGRHRIGMAILELFARQGIAFAYPTQTTYTASPDGTLVMPYAAFPPPMPTPAASGDSPPRRRRPAK